jgi:very-short-patch-repair endonuclease
MVEAVMCAYKSHDIALYGPTALQVLGVSLPTALEDWQACHVIVSGRAYRPVRREVVSHRTTHPLRIWARIKDMPVLHPVEHWAQMAPARESDMVEIGDGLVRRQSPLLSLADLRRHVADMPRVSGVRQVKRVLRQVVSNTDSIYETRTRLLLTEAGLPCPTVNHAVHCRSVGRTYHVDMGYEAEKIAVEYDGLIHVGDRRTMEIDAVRRRALQEAGWLIITATAQQLANPVEFVRSVEAALILRRSGTTR